MQWLERTVIQYVVMVTVKQRTHTKHVYMCAYTYISHEEGFCLQLTEHLTPEA